MAKKSAAKKSAGKKPGKVVENTEKTETSVETTEVKPPKKPRASRSAKENISAFDKPEKERTLAEQMLVDQYNSRLEFHDKLH